MARKAEFAGLILWFTTLTVAVTAQVSLPAVVVDGSGQALHGLQKPDFEVRCGKAASFDSVEEVSPLKFSNFSNPIPVFILLDTISIPKPRQSEVEQLLLSYLRKAADDHLAVTVLATTTTGIRIVHDMSTDSKVFVAALDRIQPKAGQGAPPTPVAPDAFAKAVDDEVVQLQLLTQPMANLPTDDHLKLMSLQLQSLTMVGKMLQRSPKRKPLVWISGSFPAHRDKEEHNLVINYTFVNQYSLAEARLEAAGSLEPSFETAIIR